MGLCAGGWDSERRRFSAFFEGAHFLAGERDRETQDFWSEGMVFPAEVSAAPSEAWTEQERSGTS